MFGLLVRDPHKQTRSRCECQMPGNWWGLELTDKGIIVVAGGKHALVCPSSGKNDPYIS